MKKHFAYIRGPFSVKRTIKSEDEWDVMLQKCALVSCTVVECFLLFSVSKVLLLKFVVIHFRTNTFSFVIVPKMFLSDNYLL